MYFALWYPKPMGPGNGIWWCEWERPPWAHILTVLSWCLGKNEGMWLCWSSCVTRGVLCGFKSSPYSQITLSASYLLIASKFSATVPASCLLVCCQTSYQGGQKLTFWNRKKPQQAFSPMSCFCHGVLSQQQQSNQEHDKDGTGIVH